MRERISKHELPEEVQDAIEHSDFGAEVYFLNGTWAVTNYGLEERPPSAGRRWGHYQIGVEELGDPTWASQMGSKSWVNLGEFIEALRRARVVHAGAFKPSAWNYYAFDEDRAEQIRKYEDGIPADKAGSDESVANFMEFERSLHRDLMARYRIERWPF